MNFLFAKMRWRREVFRSQSDPREKGEDARLAHTVLYVHRLREFAESTRRTFSGQAIPEATLPPCPRTQGPAFERAWRVWDELPPWEPGDEADAGQNERQEGCTPVLQQCLTISHFRVDQRRCGGGGLTTKCVRKQDPCWTLPDSLLGRDLHLEMTKDTECHVSEGSSEKSVRDPMWAGLLSHCLQPASHHHVCNL